MKYFSIRTGDSLRLTGLLPCMLLCVLMLAACRSTPDDLAGVYAAENPEQGKPPFTLTLSPDGKGSLSYDLEDARFTWESRPDDEIWLHTRTGGIMSGRIRDGDIVLTVPGLDGLGGLIFKKADAKP